MFRSVIARTGVALSLSALVLGALAAPASAAVHTRWVDNDSKAGDGPTACDTASFHTIQAAINASHAGDSVFVCPGTYAEQLLITVPNLLVQAKPTRTATLVPPEAANLVPYDFGIDLVDIGARGVQLIGFKMNIPAGDITAGPPALPTTCAFLDSAVYANVENVDVEANTIKAVGDNTLSGDCGYAVGIGLNNSAATSPAYGAKTSDISRNVIRDFKFAGVIAEGAQSVKVYKNAIRFVHANDPATCVTVPVLGVTPDLTYPCSTPFAAVPPRESNGLFFGSAGILMEGGLTDVRANTVYSTFDLALCGPSPCSVFLEGGIVSIAGVPGSIVRDNRVNNAFIGMEFGGGGPLAASKPTALPEAPNGSQVTGNRLNENYVGLTTDESNDVFYGNRSHLNVAGVDVESPAQDNVFDSNDFRENYEVDCFDITSGSGTAGTANNWDAPNFGGSDVPQGLCIDIGPF